MVMCIPLICISNRRELVQQMTDILQVIIGGGGGGGGLILGESESV